MDERKTVETPRLSKPSILTSLPGDPESGPAVPYAGLYLALICLVAGVLLVAGAAQKSFWIDEAGTLIRVEQIMNAFERDYIWRNHFLVDASTGLWASVWGYSELGLRSLSIVWALFAMLLTYGLARDLLGERVALIAAALFGLSPLFVLYAHNARYYSLAATLSLSGAFGIVRYHATRRFPYLALYFLSMLLLYLTMYQAVIVMGALNLWWFVQWFWKRTRTWGELVAWSLANLILVGLVIVPGIEVFEDVMEQHYGLQDPSTWLFEIIKRSAFLGFAFGVGETISPLNPVAWVGLLVAGGVGLYALAANRRVLYFWLPVLFVLSVSFANVIMSLTSPWLSTIWQALPHWAFYALPFLAIWLAAGFARLGPKMALGAGILLLLVYGVGTFNYFTGRQFIQPVYTVPWREIFARIQADAEPDDVVICAGGDTACLIYSRRYGFANNRLPAWDQLTADQYPRVWWIQTNLSKQVGDFGGQKEVSTRNELKDRYAALEIFNYVPQDATIRWLKSALLGREDYEYRVNLYWFYNP
jgi:hypothetical protein